MASHNVEDGEVVLLSFVVPSAGQESYSNSGWLFRFSNWPLTASFCSSLSFVKVWNGRSQLFSHT